MHKRLRYLKLKDVDLERHVLICCYYIWGDESPASNVTDVNLFLLLEDMSFYREKDDILITRDFNARVGNKFDFIAHDNYIAFCDEDNYSIEQPSTRTSIDGIHNFFFPHNAFY